MSLRGAQRRGCAAVREERALRMRRTPCGCNPVQEPPTAYKLVRPYCLPLTRSAGTCPRPTKGFITMTRKILLQRKNEEIEDHSTRIPNAHTPIIRRTSVGRGHVLSRCRNHQLRTNSLPRHCEGAPRGSKTRAADSRPYGDRTHPHRRARPPGAPVQALPTVSTPVPSSHLPNQTFQDPCEAHHTHSLLALSP